MGRFNVYERARYMSQNRLWPLAQLDRKAPAFLDEGQGWKDAEAADPRVAGASIGAKLPDQSTVLREE